MVKETEENPETNIIIPRNYGIVIQSGSNTLFYDPARYAIGLAILMTQAELQRALKQWQEYKQKETRDLEEGVLTYVPQFTSKGIEDLMNCGLQDAEGELVSGIEKVEGSKNLWLVGGKSSIIDAKLYGNSLQADIKSKSKGYNHVHIKGPFIESGIVHHKYIYCSSPEQDWESGAKHLMSMCSHAAALESAQYLQLKMGKDFGIDYGKRNMRWKDPALVFNFAREASLSNLLMDILIARYIRGETFYTMNRKLANGEIRNAIFSTPLNETAKEGLARYAVMRQMADKKGRSKSYQTAENQWTRKVRDKIKEKGYFRTQFYTVAFMNSPFETIAEKWENGDNVFELTFIKNEAPIIVKKVLHGHVKFHDSPLPYGSNPFIDMEKKGTGGEKSFDPCASRDCCMRVIRLEEMTREMGMAKEMQEHYRGSIKRAKRKQAEKERPKQPELPF